MVQVLGASFREGDYVVLRRFGKNRIVRVMVNATTPGKLGRRVKVRPVVVATNPWLALHLERIERRRTRWSSTVFLVFYTALKPAWLHTLIGRPQIYVFTEKKKAGEFVDSYPNFRITTRLAVAMHRHRHKLPFLLVYVVLYPILPAYVRRRQF